MNNTCMPSFVFFSSDPDELVDQLKLLYFEKVGKNDNPQLNEQIIAITDKLLEYEEYEYITTNHYQNTTSSEKYLLLEKRVCILY